MSLVFYPQTVLEFNLVPEDITVVENDTEVEVCVVSTGTLARNVVITAETGPKSGALDQATGIT